MILKPQILMVGVEPAHDPAKAAELLNEALADAKVSCRAEVFPNGKDVIVLCDADSLPCNEWRSFRDWMEDLTGQERFHLEAGYWFE